MMLPLHEPCGFAVEAAADAMAQQDMFAIGGYLKLVVQRVSERSLHKNVQRVFACAV